MAITESPTTVRLQFFQREPLQMSDQSPVESQILDATRRCLLQYGSAKLSMTDIAREAGVSRATLYNYFPDRKTLIDGVIRVMIGFVTNDLEVSMASETRFEDKVAAAAVCILEWRDLEVSSGILSPIDQATQISISANWVLPMMLSVFRNQVSEAQRQGQIRKGLNVDRAAEWIARIVLSLTIFPAQTFDMDNRRDVKQFFKSFGKLGFE
jgi:AcrR family transcriptional regulator